MDRVSLIVDKEDGGRTVAAVLKDRMLFSRSLLRRVKREGRVFLNGAPALLVDRVEEGDSLEVDTQSGQQSDIDPEEIPLHIEYEDNSLLAVNKPAGMLVHPVRRERHQTLANAVMFHWIKQGKTNAVFRPVYRIDRDTSGLVLVSGSHPAHLSLVAQVLGKTMKRLYIAVAEGMVQADRGTVDEPIDRKSGSIIERQVSPAGVPAVTHYRVIRRLPEINATVLELSLETGRTHQIRVHMAYLGHPLLGDSLYGGSCRHIKRQALHSYRLVFSHPQTGKKVDLRCSLPDDIKSLI